MTHSTGPSRRSLLAGAGLTSVSMIAPSAFANTRSSNAAWAKAVTDWQTAHATVVRYNTVPGGVADDLMDRATSVECAAAYRLATLPAPDRAAVGIKLNALLDFLEGCTIDVATLREIAADALRAGGASQ